MFFYFFSFVVVFLMFCIFFVLWLLNGKSLKNIKSINTDLNTKLSLLDKTKFDLDKANELVGELGKKNTELYGELVKERTEKEKLGEYLSERLKELSDLKTSMKDTLDLFSKQILSDNSSLINASFKKSLEEFFSHSEREKKINNEQISNVVNPLKESLAIVDKKISDLEKLRASAYSSLYEQINSLTKSQNNLAQETISLRASLNAPSIRGRWGEMQLRRVVELSGLSAHCDFLEQKNIEKEGEVLRPDMVVTLPQNKKIVIDAKAPVDSIFQSSEELTNEQKQVSLIVSALRRHIVSLNKKSYAKMLNDTPEFVVMFLPAEALLSKALLADPSLIDYAAQNEVVLATPLTLIAILKAVSFTFKQEAIAQNIEEVRKLSTELIERIGKVQEHFEKLGKNLKNANESYEQTLRSLDSRVLVTARKLSELKNLKSSNESYLNPQVDEDLPSNTLM